MCVAKCVKTAPRDPQRVQDRPQVGSLPPHPNFAASFLAFLDRKSTRLNSSHGYISYAVFCLKKKKIAVNMTVFVSPTSINGSYAHAQRRTTMATPCNPVSASRLTDYVSFRLAPPAAASLVIS